MRVSIPLSISSRVPLVAPITACAGKQIKISTNSMEASTVIQDAGMTWSAITDRYDSAQTAHIATITDTAPEVLVDALPQGSSPAQIHFLLRIATALREKPKGPSSVTTSVPKTWRNPFLPPDPDLFVCHLSASHSLVLNKFNVVPHHVLVITREFAKQEEPLTAEDMEATLAVVQCMPGDGGLAYFNRGPCSGASQPHKHIQVQLQIVPLPLLPLTHPATNGGDPPLWPVVGAAANTAARACSIPPNGIFEVTALPFVHYATLLDPNSLEATKLARLHSDMLRKAANAVDSSQDSETFSYNTILTKRYMMVIPRRIEFAGPVSCNAMAFAGSFFVRSKQELEYIRKMGPLAILAEAGFPKTELKDPGKI